MLYDLFSPYRRPSVLIFDRLSMSLVDMLIATALLACP